MNDDEFIDNKAKMKIIFWLKIVGIVLLLLSLTKLPYGYYTFLRIFITGTGLYSAYNYYTTQNIFWILVFSFIAILFNPIIPIYMERETWGVIDISTSLVFFISIFILKEYRLLKK